MGLEFNWLKGNPVGQEKIMNFHFVTLVRSDGFRPLSKVLVLLHLLPQKVVLFPATDITDSSK